MSQPDQDIDNELEDAFSEFANEGNNEDVELSQHEDAADEEPEAEQDDSEVEEAEEAEPEAEDPEAQEPSEELDELSKYKAENDDWRHKYQSDLGRQNALQRKLQEQEEQLEQLRSKKAEGSGLSDDQWKALKEDYPDIAGAFESKFNSMSSEYQDHIKSLESKITPMQEQQQQQYRDSQLNRLTTAHSDWREVSQSNEYQSWLVSQPNAVQDLMGSPSADDNIYLLNTFKATQPVKTNELQQRRQKQLQQAQTVPGRSVRAKTQPVADDDFDAAFDYYANKK